MFHPSPRPSEGSSSLASPGKASREDQIRATSELLLGAHEDPNRLGVSGDTPLHAAFLRRNQVLFGQILQWSGANPTIRNAAGDSVLDQVSRTPEGRPFLEMLASPGIRETIPQKNWEEALHQAVDCANTKGVRFLLDLGVSIESRAYPMNFTPLHTATCRMKPHIKTAFLLIKRGAIATMQDADGCTPIHYTVVGGSAAILREMLQGVASESLSIRDSDGNTPLHMAAIHSKHLFVRYLLQAGANFRLMNNQGLTAMHCAAYAGNIASVALFIQYGADLKDKDAHGRDSFWHVNTRADYQYEDMVLAISGARDQCVESLELVDSPITFPLASPAGPAPADPPNEHDLDFDEFLQDDILEASPLPSPSLSPLLLEAPPWPGKLPPGIFEVALDF